MEPEHILVGADVVKQAHANRIQLWSDGFYRTPKIHPDKTTLTGRPFWQIEGGFVQGVGEPPLMLASQVCKLFLNGPLICPTSTANQDVTLGCAAAREGFDHRRLPVQN